MSPRVRRSSDITKQICGKVIGDNGPQYSSNSYKVFAKEWGFEHLTQMLTILAECCVQSVISAMRKAKMSNQSIIMVLLCLRSTPLDHIILSPELQQQETDQKYSREVPE